MAKGIEKPRLLQKKSQREPNAVDPAGTVAPGTRSLVSRMPRPRTNPTRKRNEGTGDRDELNGYLRLNAKITGRERKK
ncbi:MAG: hypothetical protein ACOX2D_13620 [Fermentimonas sp.]